MTPCFYRLCSATVAVCQLLLNPGDSFAQTPSASLSGTVRTSDGTALEQAFIVAGQRRAVPDKLGNYRLDSLPAGTTRVLVRRIGYSQRDTTIAFTSGRQDRWDVRLRPLAFDEEMDWTARAADDAKAGRIDSIALSLIKPNPNLTLPLGAFGSRLFARVVAERGADSNTVLSPLSAGIALSLARFGASGATARALDNVLGMAHLDRATIESRGAQMMRALSQRTDVVLSTANAVWVDTSAQLMPGFRASAERWYAAASTLPLGSQRALAAINQWADSVTHKKISVVLPKALPDTTRLFIANAVYFNGKWLDPFEKSATQPGPFTLASGQQITVPRMSRMGTFDYARANGYQVLRLPYRTGKVAMYLILPDSGASFNAVASRLKDGVIPSVPLARTGKVHLVLPRFHAELALGLNEALAALGAGIAFDCDAADFSAMAQPRARGPMPLCIGQVTQKVYIDVNEEGTEAAAVTGIITVTTTSYTPPTEFVVDRPFFFVLRDETTGADLFLGRIARP